jgi:hypothetical protein
LDRLSEILYDKLGNDRFLLWNQITVYVVFFIFALRNINLIGVLERSQLVEVITVVTIRKFFTVALIRVFLIPALVIFAEVLRELLLKVDFVLNVAVLIDLFRARIDWRLLFSFLLFFQGQFDLQQPFLFATH